MAITKAFESMLAGEGGVSTKTAEQIAAEKAAADAAAKLTGITPVPTVDPVLNPTVSGGKPLIEDETGYVDYVKGANIAGFVKLADAMIAQGVV